MDYSYLMSLAGYLEETQEETPPKAVLCDSDGGVHELTGCIREIYETDPEWLQTAYRACRELNDKDRQMLTALVQAFLAEKRKQNCKSGKRDQGRQGIDSAEYPFRDSSAEL